MEEPTSIAAGAAAALAIVGVAFGAAGVVGPGLGIDIWPDLDGKPTLERERLAADPTRPGIHPLGPVSRDAPGGSFAFAAGASGLRGGPVSVPAARAASAPAVPSASAPAPRTGARSEGVAGSVFLRSRSVSARRSGGTLRGSRPAPRPAAVGAPAPAPAAAAPAPAAPAAVPQSVKAAAAPAPAQTSGGSRRSGRRERSDFKDATKVLKSSPTSSTTIAAVATSERAQKDAARGKGSRRGPSPRDVTQQVAPAPAPDKSDRADESDDRPKGGDKTR